LPEVAKGAGLTTSILYNKTGRGAGRIVSELLASSLVEANTFPGERGRGGEVTKLRVAYGIDDVRSYTSFLEKSRAEKLR